MTGLYAALLLAWPVTASAAPVAPLSLTWEDCVAFAAKKNPELASSAFGVESGRASYYGSFNGLLPQVTLSNSYGNSGGASATAYRWQAQAGAGMNLLDMGQIASVRSASAGLTRAEASLRLASANVRLGLRQAFAQLLFAASNAEVSKRVLALRERNADLVTLRYDSGRESKGNMMRARAQVLQAQVAMAQANRVLRTAQKALDRQLGLDAFSALIASGTLEARSPPPLPEDWEPLLAARPDVAVQQAEILNVKAGVAAAQSALWPKLSVDYTRSAQGRVEFPSSRYSWSARSLLSYSLFGAGPTDAYYAVSGAKKNLAKAEQDLRSVVVSAVVDLETSWSNFASAVDQVGVQAALLGAARQRNDEADVRYASGLLTYDQWEIISSDRINTEHQAVQARFNAVNAEALWARATGRLLGE